MNKQIIAILLAVLSFSTLAQEPDLAKVPAFMKKYIDAAHQGDNPEMGSTQIHDWTKGEAALTEKEMEAYQQYLKKLAADAEKILNQPASE